MHTLRQTSHKLHRAHKIRLYPTSDQESCFRKACGVARFAYNWGLHLWKERYKEGLPVSAYWLRRYLNSIKREQYPWMLDVTKCSPMESLLDLKDAFDRFFKKQAGYPKFKKKGLKDAFKVTMDAGSFEFNGKSIRLPKIG